MSTSFTSALFGNSQRGQLSDVFVDAGLPGVESVTVAVLRDGGSASVSPTTVGYKRAQADGGCSLISPVSPGWFFTVGAPTSASDYARFSLVRE